MRILRCCLFALALVPLACSSNTPRSATGSGGGSGGGDGSGGGNGSGGGSGGGGGSIFQPTKGTAWQWQLSGLPLDLSVDVPVYDIDLFETKPEDIAKLHADGRKVICYFSAGSFESFRPDADDFPAEVKGQPLDAPFQDERWLDIRSDIVRGLMKKRLDLAAQKSCDAVEPDNVDGYSNDNGFALTAADQIDFNRFIATEAHARKLSVGLKNDLDQLDDLVDSFDWALDEECVEYQECDLYAKNFLAANKAVFQAEYVDESQLAAVCAVTKPLGISTILKHIQLDAWRKACP